MKYFGRRYADSLDRKRPQSQLTPRYIDESSYVYFDLLTDNQGVDGYMVNAVRPFTPVSISDDKEHLLFGVLTRFRKCWTILLSCLANTTQKGAMTVLLKHTYRRGQPNA